MWIIHVSLTNEKCLYFADQNIVKKHIITYNLVLKYFEISLYLPALCCIQMHWYGHHGASFFEDFHTTDVCLKFWYSILVYEFQKQLYLRNIHMYHRFFCDLMHNMTKDQGPVRVPQVCQSSHMGPRWGVRILCPRCGPGW